MTQLPYEHQNGMLSINPRHPTHEDLSEQPVIVLEPELLQFWIRIKGAVYPFVVGTIGGLVGAAMTVYTIR
jgi:hypothetical protein